MDKTIDPIYKKYVNSLCKGLQSTEFYEYFSSAVKAGKNIFQFSNRRIEKEVDERWVSEIEAVIKPMQEIINNPRNFIMQEEIIVNVALAKKVSPDTIRHLAQHGDMIDSISEDSVRPNRLMEKFKEDTWNTYENKFVYTLLEMTWEFVDKRYESIFASMNEEFGAFLKLESDSKTYQERIHVNMDIRIQQEEDLLSANDKNEDIFSRIARLHRLLTVFRSSQFAKTMEKYGKIRQPLVRTNAIAKNPNFKACHRLWNFIIAYNEVGYSINIYEQNPDIDDGFTNDIYNTIMFDYIILKNYLEMQKDRAIDTSKPFKKKEVKPHFIKQIQEQQVDESQYDMPDVEIRKVLIQPITKEDLLKEEKAVQLKLIEDKQREIAIAKRAEEERLAQLKRDQEREDLRSKKERLQELERLKKEEELAKKEAERRAKNMLAELDKLSANRAEAIKQREAEEQARLKRLEAERLAKEKAERLAREKAEREARLEQERREKEEKERLLAEKREAERIAEEEKRIREIEEKEKAEKAEKLAREKAEKQAQLEKEKAEKQAQLEKEKAEKERLAKEKAEKLAKERAERQAKLEQERKEKEKLLKEKQEAERLAKEQAEREAKLEQERREKEENGRLLKIQIGGKSIVLDLDYNPNANNNENKAFATDVSGNASSTIKPMPINAMSEQPIKNANDFIGFMMNKIGAVGTSQSNTASESKNSPAKNGAVSSDGNKVNQ